MPTVTMTPSSGETEDSTISSADIVALARTPKKVENDEGKIEERSVEELIMADKYTQQSTTSGPPYGMRMARHKPPGTI